MEVYDVQDAFLKRKMAITKEAIFEDRISRYVTTGNLRKPWIKSRQSCISEIMPGNVFLTGC